MQAAKSLMPPTAGSEAVTLMGRLGYGARGVVYFLVGASAARAGIALGLWRGGGERNVQSWIAWLSAWDYGRLLIGIIGAAVLVGGTGLLVWGIVGDVDREVALPQRQKRLIRPLARYGIAGRGAAVALVGCFLIAAAFYGNPREADALGGGLAALRAG